MSDAFATVDPTPTDWTRSGDAAAHPPALRGRAALQAGRARRGSAVRRLPRLPAGHDDGERPQRLHARPRFGSTSARRQAAAIAAGQPRGARSAEGVYSEGAWVRLRDARRARQGQCLAARLRPRSTSPPRATATADGAKRPIGGSTSEGRVRTRVNWGFLTGADATDPTAGRHLGRVQGLAADDDRHDR